MKHRVGWILVSSILACSPEPSMQKDRCRTDSDCNRGRYCVSERCHSERDAILTLPSDASVEEAEAADVVDSEQSDSELIDIVPEPSTDALASCLSSVYDSGECQEDDCQKGGVACCGTAECPICHDCLNGRCILSLNGQPGNGCNQPARCDSVFRLADSCQDGICRLGSEIVCSQGCSENVCRPSVDGFWRGPGEPRITIRQSGAALSILLSDRGPLSGTLSGREIVVTFSGDPDPTCCRGDLSADQNSIVWSNESVWFRLWY
jgi:hypothetical protein